MKEKLREIFNDLEQKETIYDSDLDKRGIEYKKIKMKPRYSSAREFEVYFFYLDDGVYTCDSGMNGHIIEIGTFSKIDDEKLNLLIEKERKMRQELKDIEEMMSHPSLRLRKMFVENKN